MECHKTKNPFPTNHETGNSVNQSKLDAYTCSLRKAREIHLSVPLSALNGHMLFSSFQLKKHINWQFLERFLNLLLTN